MELIKYEMPVTTKAKPMVEVSARCSKCGREFSSEVYEDYLSHGKICKLLGMAKVTVTLPVRYGADEASGSFLLCENCLEEMLSELGLTLEDVLPPSISTADITVA